MKHMQILRTFPAVYPCVCPSFCPAIRPSVRLSVCLSGSLIHLTHSHLVHPTTYSCHLQLLHVSTESTLQRPLYNCLPKPCHTHPSLCCQYARTTLLCAATTITACYTKRFHSRLAARTSSIVKTQLVSSSFIGKSFTFFGDAS